MKKSAFAKTIAKISEGVLSKTVDMALVVLYFNLEFPSKIRGSQRWKISDEVGEDLATVNYQTIKAAFFYLKRKGLVQTFKEKSLLPKITSQGEERLRAILPQYLEERPWDGRIYLITYDLPIKKNFVRNNLRRFLKKIGAGLLQQSLWLTPYNPTSLLEKFINEQGIETDLILVSSLGKDGTIGEMELSVLMERVYHLSEINAQYRDFLYHIEKNAYSRSQTIFRYLSILEKDPQIPFELLPENWLGEEAHVNFMMHVHHEIKAV